MALKVVRNKLTDPIDEMMFSKMICPQGEAATSSDDANPWTSCVEQVNGRWAIYHVSEDMEFSSHGFGSRGQSRLLCEAGCIDGDRSSSLKKRPLLDLEESRHK